uniref:ABC-2 type transporter domain-containing protein n=1 Tax=Halydictyon mirabile TaxID=189652 RepID=A0A4D6WSY4_9FLOR|nr:hypothetical protein [Halydictyon mirabile]
MPFWLQLIACINPLTYAIEIIRHVNIIGQISWHNNIIITKYFTINIEGGIIILLIVNIISFVIIKKVLQYKYN